MAARLSLLLPLACTASAAVGAPVLSPLRTRISSLRSIAPERSLSSLRFESPRKMYGGEAHGRLRVRASIEEEEEEDQDQLYARSLAADVMKEQGVELDQLMNPMKAIRLYKEVEEKKTLLEAVSDENSRSMIQEELVEATAKLSIEKRSVMRQELKRVFLIQSLLSIVISGMLATNHFPGYPDLPIAGQALGFWTPWLFTIPSLRARKPKEIEKQALNIAFVLTPILNIGIPFVDKDPGLIWAANVIALGLCYAYAFTAIDEESAKESGVQIEGMARWLDWGTGRERGAPKEVREEIERMEREARQQEIK